MKSVATCMIMMLLAGGSFLAAASEVSPKGESEIQAAPVPATKVLDEDSSTTDEVKIKAAPAATTMADQARLVGEQIGLVELQVWKIVAESAKVEPECDPTDFDKAGIEEAVESYMVAQHDRIKGLIADAKGLQCQMDTTGQHVTLRMRTREVSTAFREGYGKAVVDLAELKKKLASSDATRAVSAAVMISEREFRSAICRKILAESGYKKPAVPTRRQNKVETADS